MRLGRVVVVYYFAVFATLIVSTVRKEGCYKHSIVGVDLAIRGNIGRVFCWFIVFAALNVEYEYIKGVFLLVVVIYVVFHLRDILFDVLGEEAWLTESF